MGSRKIILCTAIGSGLGTCISGLVPDLLWWVGAIVGGLLAGVILCGKEILSTAPMVAAESWATLQYLPSMVKSLSKSRSVSANVAMATCVWLAMLALWVVGVNLTKQYELSNIMKFHILVVWGLQLFLSFISGVIRLDSEFSEDYSAEKKIGIIRQSMIISTPAGTIYLIITALRIVPKIIFSILVAFREIMKFVGRFVWGLLLTIHSREFYAVMFDASLGATMVYWTVLHTQLLPLAPATFIGALLGGLLGWVNYEYLFKSHVRQSF